MTPSDKDDILHAIDSATPILGNLETVIDVLHYPFGEITKCDGFLVGC
jgi:hypothetical protein